MSTYLWFCLQFCRSASLFKDILRLLNGVLNSKQKTCSFFKLVMNMQVLGGCIVLMKQKASFVSASFNESRYEIQGFLHTLFLENEAQTSEKKKPKQCISSKTKSTCQNSTTSEHFQKWPKNQGVVLALSLSIACECNFKTTSLLLTY